MFEQTKQVIENYLSKLEEQDLLERKSLMEKKITQKLKKIKKMRIKIK